MLIRPTDKIKLEEEVKEILTENKSVEELQEEIDKMHTRFEKIEELCKVVVTLCHNEYIKNED
jgi:uncharacterized protein YgfB (UPF0149 family)